MLKYKKNFTHIDANALNMSFFVICYESQVNAKI